MTISTCHRRIERRAEAAGCEIHDVPDISAPMVFHCLGQPPRIFIPLDYPAPYHGIAVLAMMDRLATRVWAEDVRIDLWAELVRQVGWPGAATVAGLEAAD